MFSKKRFTLIVLLTVLLTGMIGCGSDDDKGTGPSEGDGLGALAGTWDYVASVTSGTVSMIHGMDLTIEEDGSWSSMAGTTLVGSGTAMLESIEGEEFLILAVEQSATPEIIGDTLVYSIDNNDYYMTVDYILDGIKHDVLVRDKDGSNGFVGMLYKGADMGVLANADVTVTPAEGDAETLTTDSYGMIASSSIPVGSATLSCTMNGYQDLSQTVTIEENMTAMASMAMQVANTPTTTGTVLGYVNGDGMGQLSGYTITSDDGVTFTEQDQMPYLYVMVVGTGTRTLTASLEGYQSSSLQVTVTEDDTVRQDFTLTMVQGGMGTITGTITNNQDASPIYNATISCGAYSTTSLANGTYSLDVEVGEWMVQVSADGFETETFPVTFVEGQTVTHNVSMTPGATQEFFTLQGYVYSAETDMPLPNVSVTSEQGVSGMTNSSGLFQVTLVTGEHTMTIAKDGYQSYTETVTNYTTMAYTMNDVFLEAMDYGTALEGRVTDANSGTGIEGAYVYGSTSGNSTYTDQFGNYVLQFDTAGPQGILVDAEGYAEYQTTVTLTDGVTSTLDVQLNPEGSATECTITGRITYINQSDGLMHAKVSVSSSLYTYTDFDGNYSLVVPVPEEQYYEVTATHPAFTAASNNVGVAEGQEVMLDLNLGRNSEVTYIFGTVVDGDGNPVSGVRFEGDGFSANGNSDGTFAFQPMVMSGPIEAWKDGYSSDHQNYATSFGSSIRMDFVLNAQR